MSRVDKTVFVSYRRTNVAWALAIFKYLTNLGYDVFFDYTSIASGDFEQVILGNIKARAHFIVLLTPSALERCNEPGDWLRREIECALEHKRNIVPLMLEGFHFSTPAIAQCLTGNLALLKQYSALRVPADYFDAAMQRLQQEFLNISLDAVLHPVSTQAGRAVRMQQAAAGQAGPVLEKELTAQEWFERGNARAVEGDWDGAIADYSTAIRLDPSFAPTYYNRAIVHHAKGDRESRDVDLAKGFELGGWDLAKHFWRKLVTAPGGKANSPQDWITWGKYSEALAEHDAAIHCYTQAIRLDPGNFEHYVRRGSAHVGKGDLSSACEDVDRAIRLAPDSAVAYSNRGTIRAMTDDLSGAIDDFSHAIRFAPTIALHYRNRAYAHRSKGNAREAIDDFQRYLDLGGGVQNNDQKEVEDLMQDLRRQVKRRGFSLFRR